jgi:hypothetical protein
MQFNGTTDRQPSGRKDRLGAQVVVPTFRKSPTDERAKSPYPLQGRAFLGFFQKGNSTWRILDDGQ